MKTKFNKLVSKILNEAEPSRTFASVDKEHPDAGIDISEFMDAVAWDFNDFEHGGFVNGHRTGIIKPVRILRNIEDIDMDSVEFPDSFDAGAQQVIEFAEQQLREYSRVGKEAGNFDLNKLKRRLQDMKREYQPDSGQGTVFTFFGDSPARFAGLGIVG